MNYSALLVTSKPDLLQDTLDALALLEHVEVHQVQKELHRCIVVIEAEDVNSEVDIFKSISRLETVMDVSLIVHHFEDQAETHPIQDLDILTK